MIDRLTAQDRVVLKAGLALLVVNLLLHLPTLIIRIHQHRKGNRSLWVAKFIHRDDGSFIVFSPGISWTLVGIVCCVGKLVHGTIRLVAEERDQEFGNVTSAACLGLYMVIFTLQTLGCWLVWSGSLCQARSSFRSFQSTHTQKKQGSRWLINMAWNAYFLSLPVCVTIASLVVVGKVVSHYSRILNLVDQLSSPTATNQQLARLAPVLDQELHTFVKFISSWLVVDAIWIGISAVLYGGYSIWLLYCFKAEERLTDKLRRGAVCKPSFHDKHLVDYQPNLPLVSARHLALRKKARQLTVMVVWSAAFWIYVLVSVTWYLMLSRDDKIRNRIAEKSSLAADKLGFALFDLPIAVYILVSTLRYSHKRTSTHGTPAMSHPLEMVYPKDATEREREMCWGVNDQRAEKPVHQVALGDDIKKTVSFDNSSDLQLDQLQEV